MSKKPEKIIKLESYLSLKEPVPILPLPNGLGDYRVIIGPCIFVGDIYHRIILHPKDITISILEKLFDKALKDSDYEATIDLLHYAIYNKKTFWRRYRGTALGTQVMATILGQHD